MVAYVNENEPLVDAGLPESRVLIIGTGGTICMQEGPDGLTPSEGFLESAMAPRPTFNDMSGLDGMSMRERVRRLAHT